MKWPPRVHKSILFKPHALSFLLQPIQLLSWGSNWPDWGRHCAWHATEHTDGIAQRFNPTFGETSFVCFSLDLDLAVCRSQGNHLGLYLGNLDFQTPRSRWHHSLTTFSPTYSPLGIMSFCLFFFSEVLNFFFNQTITCIESASYLAWPPSRLFVIVSQLRLISPQHQRDTTIWHFLCLCLSSSFSLSLYQLVVIVSMWCNKFFLSQSWLWV